MKIKARALLKRGAAQVWLSQFDKAIEDFDLVLNNKEFCGYFKDSEVANLHKDKARVQQRMRSNKIKIDGDREFYHEKMNDAYEYYEHATNVDKENEYALANMGVIHLKKLEYKESIDYATQAIEIINNF